MPVYQGFAHSLLLQAPLFIVVIVVLVMSLVRWSRHPKASALALAGTIVVLAETIASVAVYTWIPLSASTASMSQAQSDRLYDGIGLLDSVAHAVGLGLCFMAIFVGRRSFDAAFPVEHIPTAYRAPPPLPPRQF